LSVQSSDSEEIGLQSSENVITISFNTNAVDASTQTSESTCKCDEVMVQLGKVLDVLNTLTEEMAMHSSDLYDIRRSVSLENKVDSMVSSMYMSIHAPHMYASCKYNRY